MGNTTDFQSSYGTALVTFATHGTYSSMVDIRGGHISSIYAVSWAGSNTGSIAFRASHSPVGTGFPVHTFNGTIFRIPVFAAGTFYMMESSPFETPALPFVILQVGTAGTMGHAAGGTIVLVTTHQH